MYPTRRGAALLHTWARSRAARWGALCVLFGGCTVGLVFLVIEQTGVSGFLVGMALAVLPVPAVVSAFLWLDRVEPQPYRHVAFCFAWGACASTLVALVANSWTTDLLIARSGARGELVGTSTLVPLVEESTKATAVLLVFLLRPARFHGPLSGLALAGVTACGFAFTENILYVGRSFSEGFTLTDSVRATLSTLVVREGLCPLAHPLFTCATGLGLGLAAVCSGRLARVLAPLTGWLVAMLLHGLWNVAAGSSMVAFLHVYGALMVPVFLVALLLALWTRTHEARVAARRLPRYVRAGWIAPHEPALLGSMFCRQDALRLARGAYGTEGEAALRRYFRTATALAMLRRRIDRGVRVRDAEAWESQLLRQLWRHEPHLKAVLAAVRPPLASDRGYGPRAG